MRLPVNQFKAALALGKSQVGLWNSMGGNSARDVVGSAGFDFVVVDTEHAATETVEVQYALQVLAGYPDVAPIVRPAANDPVLIKRHLDMGAQTLLVPMVDTAQEAAAAVASMRYPPRGVRGMAGAVRATRYGRVQNYVQNVESELCLVVQVESAQALDQLEEIAGVDGVDAVFFGPSDLSASLGYPGQPAHPEVVRVMEEGIARLAKLDVPSGILQLNPDAARHFIEVGAAFVAVGLDVDVLVKALAGLKSEFR